MFLKTIQGKAVVWSVSPSTDPEASDNHRKLLFNNGTHSVSQRNMFKCNEELVSSTFPFGKIPN